MSAVIHDKPLQSLLVIDAGVYEKNPGSFNELLAGIADDLRLIEIRRTQSGGTPQGFIDFERSILARLSFK